jgi:hypothetical protein
MRVNIRACVSLQRQDLTRDLALPSMGRPARSDSRQPTSEFRCSSFTNAYQPSVRERRSSEGRALQPASMRPKHTLAGHDDDRFAVLTGGALKAAYSRPLMRTRFNSAYDVG